MAPGTAAPPPAAEDAPEERRTGTAMVFPGMGPVKYADVSRFLLTSPHARRLRKAAEEVLGYSLADRYRESEEDYAEVAQVVFLVNCLALAEWARERHGVEPVACAGPSFGQKAVTAFSGALPFPEVVDLTARLARCEADYFAREHRDVVTLSFVRVPEDELAPVLAEMDDRGAWYDISCHLDHDFFMVSLREGELDAFQRRLRSLGGLPLYTMRPPMHSAAFGALRRTVEEEVLPRYRFADPRLPVVADQDGTVVDTAEGMRTLLLDGIVRPVRWPDVVRTLRGLGVGRVCVAGPDGLFGRVGCTVNTFDVLAADPRAALRPRTPAPLPA